MGKKGGGQQQPSAKNKVAKREKSAQDKTFGLKNKNKSSKVQKYVSQVETQVAGANSAAAKRKEAEKAKKDAEKKASEAAKAEARALFSSSIQQKVPFGVDPKSVVCAFFKQGLCNKGARCKFSHDLGVERKGEKKDLYSDDRDSKERDTMDNWDVEKLQRVILTKHGKARNTTDKICKYFIDAVENGKYGWFWICPNGGDQCIYRHSLPPGFKLKTKEEQRLERQALANAPRMTLEDFIENERHKLPKHQTPVTLETFKNWKLKRMENRKKEEKEAEKKKVPLSGRQLMMSGRYTKDEPEDVNDIWDLSEMRRDAENTGSQKDDAQKDWGNAETLSIAI